METLAIYLLKSALWLSGFAIIYFLFLRNERFFQLNRFYLVSGILVSFLFPLISVHYPVEIPAVENVDAVELSQAATPVISQVQQVMPGEPFDYRLILLLVYLSGVLFFAIKVILHIRSLYSAINKANINNLNHAKLIRASEFSSSFSFFNYVFINPSVSDIETEEIMNHELVHIRQKHWFDLILVEMLCLLQWANPFAWIYTRFIRSNHEYLADAVALQRTSDPAVYRAALVNQLFGTQVFSLSNSFNYSVNKKRFDMMKKIITSPYRKLKVLFVLPVIAILLYAFATPEYHYNAAAGNSMTVSHAQETVSSVIKGIVMNEEGKPLQGATIVIMGTSSGVSTDASGRFTIGNVPENASLIVSNPDKGYLSRLLEPPLSSEITVKLKIDKGNPMSLLVRASSKNGPYPLTIIDGVESNKRIDEIDENEIKAGGFLMLNDASLIYGEKGKNGVIIITTKKGAKGSNENKQADTIIKKVIIDNGNNALAVSSVKARNSFDGSPFNALIVIDGVVSEKKGAEGVKGINPNDISSISVLKDISATKKYGEKGKDGVIEITTKKIPSEISQKEVKGIVLNEDGKPLGGVNINTTGTMGNVFGTSTGPDGRFSIANLQADASLLFFCRGYKQLTLKPLFTSEMTVKMERDPAYKAPEGTNAGAPAVQRPNLVVVIDGVISEKSFGEARKELGYNMGISKMITGKEATDKYGEKGANGVYEIITRKKAIEMGLKPPFPRLAPEDYATFQSQRFQNFTDWVASQVKFPAEARAKKLEGWVSVNFSVELNGTISNVVSTIPVDPILRDEVIRVVQSSPKWDPPKNPDVDEPFNSGVILKFILPDQISKEAPFVVVEKMPMFPGGDAELMNFIKNNIRYPEKAKAEKIEGRVIIRFVVSSEGNAEAISVLKGVHPLLDAEALRVGSLLTGWKPGMQGGKAVNVWYMAPVSFTLPQTNLP